MTSLDAHAVKRTKDEAEIVSATGRALRSAPEASGSLSLQALVMGSLLQIREGPPLTLAPPHEDVVVV